MDLSGFTAIVTADFEFEFGGRDGNLPRPVCMAAKELRSGKIWRLWRDEFGGPPFPIGVDTLFVSFTASAELGCFKVLAGQVRSFAALAVMVELGYQVFKTHKREVVLSNTMLRSVGISRKAKIHALRQLEAAGVVAVDWEARKSPRVTVLWR